MSGRFSAPHHRVYLAAAIVLVVGWIAAACVFFGSAGDDGSSAGGDLTSRREMRQVERLGGTATVQTVQLDNWLGSLWHGQRLGTTLAVLSLVVAGACCHIAGLMGEEVDEEVDG